MKNDIAKLCVLLDKIMSYIYMFGTLMIFAIYSIGN